AWPPLLVPVEDHPHAVLLGGIAKDGRAFRAILLALLRALGREDLEEAVDVLDLCRCQKHLGSPFVVCRGGRCQPARTGMSTERSCGSIGPRLSTISKWPPRACAMYMFRRRWCSPGTIAAGPPGPSLISAWSRAAITSSWSSEPASVTAAAQRRSAR